ncbi:MAG: 6-phosphogluconolactonase [Phycisphaerales bacterium]|nr:6-phosphogluconolactonase [Phycisphaerales bacterium]
MSEGGIIGFDTGELPEGPSLPGTVTVDSTVNKVYDRMEEELLSASREAMLDHGCFHLAVSGDLQLTPFWRQLMYDPDARGLPWASTHLWFTEEWGLPEGDPRRTFTRLNDTIITHSGVPIEQVHAMPVAQSGGAFLYIKEIAEITGGGFMDRPGFDAVIVAAGPGGSVAGWQPGELIDPDDGGLVVRHQGGPSGDNDGLSLALAGMANASNLFVLVIGELAGASLRDVERSDDCPVSALRQGSGDVYWFFDAEAAAATE